MEKNLYMPDIIFSRKMGCQQKIKKQDKEDRLTYDSERLDKPVFFRAFFFQLLASPSRFLQILFDGRFEDRAALEVPD